MSAPNPDSGRVTMTTYKRADGELIAGEFGWVGQIDYFDHDDDATELVREVWVRESVKTIVLHPIPCFCSMCSPDDDDDVEQVDGPEEGAR